jgi:hypothetical protein
VIGTAVAVAVSTACGTSPSTHPADAGSTDDIEAAAADARTGPDGSCADDGGGGVIICDDFERDVTGNPPAPPWSVAAPNGSVTVASDRAHSGTRSVKITSPAVSGSKSTMLRLSGGGRLPDASNVVFGRMMFWLDSVPANSVHWTFIAGSGVVPGQTYTAVYRYGGQMPLFDVDGGLVGSQFIANYETPGSYSGNGPGSDCYRNAAETVPVGQWACAEWEFDGPNSTMNFWLNGAPLADLTVAGTGDGCTRASSDFMWTAPTFREIDLGWESYQSDDARTIWLDDIAIATTRIGCP